MASFTRVRQPGPVALSAPNTSASDTLRKAGARTDVDQTFKPMLSGGRVASSSDELLADSSAASV